MRKLSDGERIAGDERVRAVCFLKVFTVLNVAKCDNLPQRPSVAALPAMERIANADVFVRAIGADVRHGGDGVLLALDGINYVTSTRSIQSPGVLLCDQLP